MDNSSKAVDAALKTLREVRAALTASKLGNERAGLVFAVLDAERALRAALRAEKHPRVDCSHCRRRLKPDEPMAWRWNSYYGRGGLSEALCLSCSEPADRYEQHPCETCARVMHFDIAGACHARRPLTCSYQCNYRRKLKHQRDRNRVEHATIACIVCGEMFTQARRDAQTCSNRCRQALYRRSHRK
jgi:predicted nucleic acid-binding Zn ribbon protein